MREFATTQTTTQLTYKNNSFFAETIIRFIHAEMVNDPFAMISIGSNMESMGAIGNHKET